MSNIISLSKNSPKEEWLQMSNGAADVVIEMLVLNGSASAKTEYEKEFVVWLAEKDQNTIGIGTVGFDIDEMPWTKKNFSAEKEFMINVIKNAENKCKWDKLGYIPTEEIVVPFLKQLRALFEQMTEDLIDESSRKEWLDSADDNDPIKCGFPRCEKHNVLLSCFGCKICGAYESKLY